MANQYTAGRRPIARTITHDGRLIAEHYKGSSLESRFKYFVSVYYILWNRHIQMVNNQGEIINGANPSTFFILPMLDKHPDEYPRFRDY